MANIAAMFEYSASRTSALVPNLIGPIYLAFPSTKIDTQPVVLQNLESVLVRPVRLTLICVASPKPSDVQNPPKSFGFPS